MTLGRPTLGDNFVILISFLTDAAVTSRFLWALVTRFPVGCQCVSTAGVDGRTSRSPGNHIDIPIKFCGLWNSATGCRTEICQNGAPAVLHFNRTGLAREKSRCKRYSDGNPRVSDGPLAKRNKRNACESRPSSHGTVGSFLGDPSCVQAHERTLRTRSVRTDRGA
jgi:hypothetical protein